MFRVCPNTRWCYWTWFHTPHACTVKSKIDKTLRRIQRELITTQTEHTTGHASTCTFYRPSLHREVTHKVLLLTLSSVLIKTVSVIKTTPIRAIWGAMCQPPQFLGLSLPSNFDIVYHHFMCGIMANKRKRLNLFSGVCVSPIRVIQLSFIPQW